MFFNKWNKLYKIVKDYDGCIEHQTMHFADGYSSILTIPYAEGKKLIAEKIVHHGDDYDDDDIVIYELHCSGGDATHRLTNFVNANKIFKILNNKKYYHDMNEKKSNNIKEKQNALAFVFGND